MHSLDYCFTNRIGGVELTHSLDDCKPSGRLVAANDSTFGTKLSSKPVTNKPTTAKIF